MRGAAAPRVFELELLVKEQTTPAVYETIEENNIVYVTVPGGCTDKLQPLDLSVNRSAKCYLRDMFSARHADARCK